MKPKKNTITLILPSELESIPVTIVKGTNDRQIIMEFQAEETLLLKQNGHVSKPIFVYTNGINLRLRPEKIIYLEACGSYCKIIQDGSKELLMTFPLIEAQKFLPENFIRIHRSYVINIDYISKLSGNQIYVKDRWFTVGREYRKETFEHFIIFHAKRK